MKRILFIILIWVCCSMSWQALASPTYHYKYLQTASEKLGIEQAIDTLPEGVSFLTCKGKRVEVRINESGQVEHIGFPLFHQSLQRHPVYDFLEYSAMAHHFNLPDNNLNEQDMQFELGSWAKMAELDETYDFSVNNIEGKYYKVTWSKDRQPAVTLYFKAKYDLLANSPRREIENVFISDLKAYKPASDTSAWMLDTTRISTRDGIVYVAKGSSHIIDAINNDYYLKADSTGFSCVMSDSLPALSIANLMTAPDQLLPDCNVELHFVKYDFQSDSVTMTLKDFLRFCRSNGCVSYFGVENQSDSEITGALYLSNGASGYDHVLYVNAPASGIGTEDYTIQARAYLFTPMSNVEDMFATQKRRKPLHIIYD